MGDMESICFQIISNVGTAKSLLIEAMEIAREYNFDEAESKINEANSYIITAHKVHAQLIQQEAKGEKIPFSLLLMHAEDQLMSVETIKSLTNEIINLQKKLFNKNI